MLKVEIKVKKHSHFKIWSNLIAPQLPMLDNLVFLMFVNLMSKQWYFSILLCFSVYGETYCIFPLLLSIYVSVTTSYLLYFPHSPTFLGFSSPCFSFFVFCCCCCCCAGNWTHGRQALYYWAIPPAYFVLFLRRPSFPHGYIHVNPFSTCSKLGLF
jgi:hypothetical protein